MRKNILSLNILFIILVILCSCSPPSKLFISVENPLDIKRDNETVIVSLNSIKKKAPWLDTSNIVLHDYENNIELVTQKLDDDFLFQSNFKANEKKLFILSNTSSRKVIPESIVDVKFVLPRQDIAWENDRIAFRIYGSKLAGDVLNGIDVWVKRVRYPIIDKWYKGNALEGPQKISYHIDHGEGADFFTVGRSLGAGGAAIWKDGRIHQTSLFTSHKILATGPIRSKFLVRYEKDSIDGQPFKAEKIFTLDAGQNLNRIEVFFSGITITGKVSFAAGLVKRKNVERFADEKLGWLSVWGMTNDDSTNEYTGTGIIIPKNYFQEMIEDKEHFLIIGNSSPDKKFTYYAGACWTRSGDFKSVEDWNNYLTNYALRLNNPVIVTISEK